MPDSVVRIRMIFELGKITINTQTHTYYNNNNNDIENREKDWKKNRCVIDDYGTEN